MQNNRLEKFKHVRWPCPAKLNLFLHITGQRDDGYHLLQSVFQLVDFGDWLTFEAAPPGEVFFECDVPELNGTDNLVVKAARLLTEKARQSSHFPLPGVKICLNKVLPAGGGIGGGSSDCATTLVALNALWELGLSIDELADIGLSLGADVPVFVRGQTAFVEGIGEIITPLETPEIWYLVVHPGCHVTTAKIFLNPLLTRNSKAITIRDLNALTVPFDGMNVMQRVVTDDYPEVKKALDWLKSVNPYARMTGSGSCLFSPFDNEQEVRKIASRCEWSHFVTKAVNQSPLQSLLSQLGLNN